jgi:hypothetical protein
MNVYWVFENARRKCPFELSRLELFCLITSVINWKRLYPNTTTHLYCDGAVYDLLQNQLGAAHLWDHVDIKTLASVDRVSRKHFYAASKIKVMRTLQAPYIIMDADFIMRSNRLKLEELEPYGLVTYMLENDRFYPDHTKTPYKEMNEQEQIDWVRGFALNVAWTYMGSAELQKEFTRICWKWMNELDPWQYEKGFIESEMMYVEQGLILQLANKLGVKKGLLTNLTHYDDKISELPEGYDYKGLTFREDVHHMGHVKIQALTDPEIWEQQFMIMFKSILKKIN